MKRDGGFTLVEVLVAISILALVTLLLSNGVISNLRAERETRARAAAQAYAVSALELYRQTWAAGAANPKDTNYAKGTSPDFTVLPNLPSEYNKVTPLFQVTPVTLKDASGADITTTKDTGIVQVKQVSVTVYKGTTAAIQMSTRIGDPSKRTRIK